MAEERKRKGNDLGEQVKLRRRVAKRTRRVQPEEEGEHETPEDEESLDLDHLEDHSITILREYCQKNEAELKRFFDIHFTFEATLYAEQRLRPFLAAFNQARKPVREQPPRDPFEFVDETPAQNPDPPVLKDHWRWVQPTRTEAHDFIRRFLHGPFVPEAEWQSLDDVAPAWEDFCGRVRDDAQSATELQAQACVVKMLECVLTKTKPDLHLYHDKNFSHNTKNASNVTETIPDLVITSKEAVIRKARKSPSATSSVATSPEKATPDLLEPVPWKHHLAAIEVKADNSSRASREALLQICNSYARITRARRHLDFHFYAAATDSKTITFVKINASEGVPRVWISKVFDIGGRDPTRPPEGFLVLRRMILHLQQIVNLRAEAEAKLSPGHPPIGDSSSDAFKEQRMVVCRRGPDGEAISSEYEANLQRLLGNNCVNEIFAGTLTKLDGAGPTTDPSQVVIKVQRDAYSRQVRNEAAILGRLGGLEGVPKLRFFGVTEDGQDVLITEPVGVSLHNLFKAKKLPRETVLKLGEQLVTIMYGVHRRGVVHRDINPSNIIALFNQREHPSAALIDFGVAISRKSEPLAPITFPSDYAFCASAAHDGMPAGMRGDLESLVFTICYLLSGQLPWHPSVDAQTSRPHISTLKLAFCHNAVEGLVPSLAGTQCQKLLQAYYKSVNSAEKRNWYEEPGHFGSANKYLQNRGLCEVPIESGTAQHLSTTKPEATSSDSTHLE